MVKNSISGVCDNCLLLIGLGSFVVLVCLRYCVVPNQILNLASFCHFAGASYGVKA